MSDLKQELWIPTQAAALVALNKCKCKYSDLTIDKILVATLMQIQILAFVSKYILSIS